MSDEPKKIELTLEKFKNLRSTSEDAEISTTNIVVKHDNGKTWEIGYYGFRIDAHFDLKPDEDWYDYVRINEGLPELNSDHRRVLKFYQDFYKENGIAPASSYIARELNISKDELFKLFPTRDPLRSIIKMAGLPYPHGQVGISEPSDNLVFFIVLSILFIIVVLTILAFL
ncbi:MAG: TusE/DsrC/DsvC family sulfur relay protein [Deltaproteobacteria bacterium]|nr:TusE/DsrC/DsvC family sulfur relay protein [Deltaproteobacteria bacterium]